VEEDLKCAPCLPGCGTQHPHRALGGTRVLLAAAPTTPPCFRRWRRSSLLQRKNYFYFRGSGKSAELVGAKPLHLLTQTALPLKSPTGAFIATQTRTFLNPFFTGAFRPKFHVLERKSQTIKQNAQKGGAKFGGGGLDRSREKIFKKQNDELKRVIATK